MQKAEGRRQKAENRRQRRHHCFLLPSAFCFLPSAFCLLLAGCNREQAVPPLEETPVPSAVAPAPEGPGFFTDVTAQAGVKFQYRNGEEADLYTILESLGGGVGLLDYDQDGRLDIFLPGGGYFDVQGQQVKGYPNRLYHNEGGGRFRDVTAEAGLDGPLFYSHGCAVGDYDNDGWPDLLVTGYGRVALFHNHHGKFEDVTEKAGLAGSRGPQWSTSAAWADLNGDGLPDLFVCQYVDWSLPRNVTCRPLGPGSEVDVCSPTVYEPLPQIIYFNQGNGTFREAGPEAGLKKGKGLGVVVADVDEDGRPDIYVANDTVPNQLYLNQGQGKFEEAGLYRGVALSEAGSAAGSMGTDAADYDGSGHLSLFVANFTQQAHGLYRNRGGGYFDHVSSQAGIMGIGLNFVGFGTSFLDYDNDGAEDLILTNGHVLRRPRPPQTLAQRPILLRNLGRDTPSSEVVRFEDVSAQAGPFFQGAHRGRGLAVGDLDNDGKLDVVISHCNEPVVLLRNTLETGHHWLGVALQGRPYRDAVGARLTLEIAGRRLVREVKGGVSYLSSSDRRIVFGLGADSRIDRLTVRWPSGRSQTWEGDLLGLDHYLILEEGKPQPVAWVEGRAGPP